MSRIFKFPNCQTRVILELIGKFDELVFSLTIIFGTLMTKLFITFYIFCGTVHLTLSFVYALHRLHYSWIDIGTPSVSFLVALDAGSDLLWVPCNCIQCAPLSASYYSSLVCQPFLTFCYIAFQYFVTFCSSLFFSVILFLFCVTRCI